MQCYCHRWPISSEWKPWRKSKIFPKHNDMISQIKKKKKNAFPAIIVSRRSLVSYNPLSKLINYFSVYLISWRIHICMLLFSVPGSFWSVCVMYLDFPVVLHADTVALTSTSAFFVLRLIAAAAKFFKTWSRHFLLMTYWFSSVVASNDPLVFLLFVFPYMLFCTSVSVSLRFSNTFFGIVTKVWPDMISSVSVPPLFNIAKRVLFSLYSRCHRERSAGHYSGDKKNNLSRFFLNSCWLLLACCILHWFQ